MFVIPCSRLVVASPTFLPNPCNYCSTTKAPQVASVSI